MNPDNDIPTTQTAQLWKAAGILLLISGLLSLIFAIVRYNSLVSQAMIASGRGDTQLLLAVVSGIILALFGVLLTFVGASAINYALPIGLRMLAIYLLLLSIIFFRGGAESLATWMPIVGTVAGVFILIGSVFRKRNIGMLLLAVYLIVVCIIQMTGIGPSILLPFLAPIAGIFILIGK